MRITTLRAALPLMVTLLAHGGTVWARSGTPGAPAPPAAQAPEQAVCAICGVREKADPEPVAARFVHEGKTYSFCRQKCKEEFRLDPERWIKAAASGDGASSGGEGSAHPHAAGPARKTGGGSAAPS